MNSSAPPPPPPATNPLLAAIQNKKLKHSSESDRPAPKSSGVGGLLAEIQQGKKLRKTSESNRPAPKTESSSSGMGGLLAEIQQGKKLRKASSRVNLNEGAERLPPSNPFLREIEEKKLKPTDSYFKNETPPPPPPQVSQPQHVPPPPVQQQQQPWKKKSALPDKFQVPTDGRPVAPSKDAQGPIPDWKRKVLQGRLDKEWNEQQKRLLEKQAEEAKWAKVPAWKRKVLQEKEKRALGLAPPLEERAPPGSSSSTNQQTTFHPPPPQAFQSRQQPPTMNTFTPPPPQQFASNNTSSSNGVFLPPPPSVADQSKLNLLNQKLMANKMRGQQTPSLNIPPPAQFQSQPQVVKSTPTQPMHTETKAVPEWKKAIQLRKVKKKEEQQQAAILEKAVENARWEGIPAWKRKIIEKKEASLNMEQ
eukprot:m.105849 g.105849  ORF g.105849 m.105849 type:complete len:419 (+) comp12664_c0_seq1:2-1258(+)